MNLCKKHNIDFAGLVCSQCDEEDTRKRNFNAGITTYMPAAPLTPDEWWAKHHVALPNGEKVKITAPQLLNKALTIQDQRASQYDQSGGERSMGKVVTMFNAAKGREVLTEADGWLIQALLKIVRSEANGPHSDSVEDLVSYSSLYGEARLAEVKA